jgi:3-(3-hydroxy-phenyl)propionate hydroxylase
VPAPVVIVGAGPVGVTAAAGCVAAGVPVVLLEAAPELPRQLRASTFHPSTLDFLSRFGIVDELVSQGLVADRFQYRERTAGVVAEFDLGLLAGLTDHPYRVQVEQWRLCRVLLDRLAGNDLFEVRFGARVVDVVDDPAGAAVALDDGTRVAGSWVVGADGASSAVRKAIGAEFEGWTYEDRYLVVSTPHELADHIPELALVNYVADPEEWLVLLRTKPLWRVLFPIHDPETDEEALSDDRIEERLQRVVPKDGRYEIGHRTMYNVHQRVANTFRRGRVLLAGDAGHINTPLGGMGANGGIHDAWLLTDLLPDVWHGRRDESVMDAYADVRRRIAIEFVQRVTHENAVTLSSRDPSVRAEALANLAAKAAAPDAARAYLRQASMLEAVDLQNEWLAEAV